MLVLMKATIDVPDELFRKVEAKSALEGRTVRAVAVELFQRWLNEDATSPERALGHGTTDEHGSAQSPEPSAELLIAEWLRMGAEASKNAPPGPTATEILEADRNRL